MAQAFFSLYCLVKDTPAPKVFFKFFKDPDLLFIYPKTALNVLSVRFHPNISTKVHSLMVPRKKLSEIKDLVK